MRLIGLVLALGAIVWVMMQLAGSGDADTVIPQAHQQSLDKTHGLEQTLQADLENRMQGLESEE